MTNDPIADLLTRIRNAQQRKKTEFEIPYSKVNEAVASVLKDNRYLKDIKVFKEKGSKLKGLKIELQYKGDVPAITLIQRVSKPSLRQYVNSKEIKPVLVGGFGMYVVSTSRGIMSSIDAKKKNIGGELICKVY